MRPEQRLPYSAIVDRKPLKLPRGVRLVVWPIVNVEVWDIGRPMPRQALPPPTGVTRLPDVPHWAWHEYGNRVGFWRLKAALDRLKITPSLSVNARVCEDYPRIAKAALDAGWEFMGHSYDQRPIHLEPNQRATIRKAVRVIKQFTGKQPVGWLGPGFTQTLDTPEYLAEAGIQYICDWPIDDEPVEIRTKKGPLLALPYSIELNDISMMIVLVALYTFGNLNVYAPPSTTTAKNVPSTTNLRRRITRQYDRRSICCSACRTTIA